MFTIFLNNCQKESWTEKTRFWPHPSDSVGSGDWTHPMSCLLVSVILNPPHVLPPCLWEPEPTLFPASLSLGSWTHPKPYLLVSESLNPPNGLLPCLRAWAHPKPCLLGSEILNPPHALTPWLWEPEPILSLSSFSESLNPPHTLPPWLWELPFSHSRNDANFCTIMGLKGCTWSHRESGTFHVTHGLRK